MMRALNEGRVLISCRIQTLISWFRKYRDTNWCQEMEDRRANLVAAFIVIILIIVLVVSEVSLKRSRSFFLILGADIALILAVAACMLIRRKYTRRRKLLESQHVFEGRELRIEYSFLRKVAGVPTKFTYREIEEATDNFQAFLGQGASASVFKGILSDGTSVAVKRIGEERGEKEFKSEVAAIASVQHVHLARILGFCVVPGTARFLVYEFIPNGSLDCWIFPTRPSSGFRGTTHPGGCLSWDLRYRVAIDVAKALSYLHHDCRSRILHLDLKPENILLNENYRAIVSDFGLSKLMGKDVSRVITNIRGTRGYLAPEWLLEHGISEKSDVYSYGMVLLEIIGGQRNVTLVQKGNDRSTRKWQYFPKIAHRRMKEGRIKEILDPRLTERGDPDEAEVKRLLHVAFWCIQEKDRLRPSMARVVEMLERHVPVSEPPDTKMIVGDILSVDDCSSDGDDEGSNSAALPPADQQNHDVHNPNTMSCSMTMSDFSGR